MDTGTADLCKKRGSWLDVPGDWRRPTCPETYHLVWDEDAGFGQLLPRPTPAEAAAFYRFDYYTHGTDAQAQHAEPGFLRRLLFHLAWRVDRGVDIDEAWWSTLLGSDGARRVLEIGCGDAVNLDRLSRMGHQVCGVEPDPTSGEVARQRGVELHAGTAEDLPEAIGTRRFDVICFLHSLEHCIAPRLAIRNALAMLDDDGMIVVEVPNNECLGARTFGASWPWLDAPRHLNFFTARSLQQLMTDAGLKVVSTEFCGYCRQFSTSWIEDQGRIARMFSLKPAAMPLDLVYWALLARTAFRRPGAKYDSVRVVARRSAEP